MRMGIGGRYRATMLAVEPDCVYTTMREAPTLSAARTADDAMASILLAPSRAATARCARLALDGRLRLDPRPRAAAGQ